MIISKKELLTRVILLEDDVEVLNERIVDLEKKIKKLEKPSVKKVSKVKKG